jgi:hypothetical protein
MKSTDGEFIDLTVSRARFNQVTISRGRFDKQRDPNRVIAASGPRSDWPAVAWHRHRTSPPHQKSPYASIISTSRMRPWACNRLGTGHGAREGVEVWCRVSRV